MSRPSRHPPARTRRRVETLAVVVALALAGVAAGTPGSSSAFTARITNVNSLRLL